MRKAIVVLTVMIVFATAGLFGVLGQKSNKSAATPVPEPEYIKYEIIDYAYLIKENLSDSDIEAMDARIEQSQIPEAKEAFNRSYQGKVGVDEYHRLQLGYAALMEGLWNIETRNNIAKLGIDSH